MVHLARPSHQAAIDASERASTRLIVGHSHSFNAPVRLARNLIASGRFGAVRLIQAMNFTDFLYRPRRPEELDTARGGGVVFSQRVLLAQGLIPAPQLLVLDEPMSALDEAGIQVFERLLNDWRQAGITVLWIEHDLEAVGRLADRVTGLNRRVLFDATPQQALTPERLLSLFSTHPRTSGSAA